MIVPEVVIAFDVELAVVTEIDDGVPPIVTALPPSEMDVAEINTTASLPGLNTNAPVVDSVPEPEIVFAPVVVNVNPPLAVTLLAMLIEPAVASRLRELVPKLAVAEVVIAEVPVLLVVINIEFGALNRVRLLLPSEIDVPEFNVTALVPEFKLKAPAVAIVPPETAMEFEVVVSVTFALVPLPKLLIALPA